MRDFSGLMIMLSCRQIENESDVILCKLDTCTNTLILKGLQTQTYTQVHTSPSVNTRSQTDTHTHTQTRTMYKRDMPHLSGQRDVCDGEICYMS